MLLTLYQPSITNSTFELNELKSELEKAEVQKSDLLIFPELYPFCDGRINAPELLDAINQLKNLSSNFSCAFLAGGLAKQNKVLRNFCCLFYNGKVSVPYFKQRKFGDELNPNSDYFFKAGTKLEKFTWKNKSVIPLICADAIETLGKPIKLFSKDVLKLGAGCTTPLIVLSYAKKPLGWKWSNTLQEISDITNTTVLFCNYSDLDDDGYGGGGSGIFTPNKPPQRANNKTGLYTYEI